MNDDHWQAPGREHGSSDRPTQHGVPPAAVPPAVPTDGGRPDAEPPATRSYAPPSSADPYAAPSSPGPYATPSPADPYAAPSSPGPYATPSPGGPYAPPSSPDPYAPPSVDPYAPARRAQHPAHDAHAGAFATSDKHRDRVLGGAGYDSPRYSNDKVAVTSMVLGIFGILVPGLGLLAIAFGHLALRRLRTSYEGGRGLAIAGLAMGYAMTAIWLGIGLLLLAEQSLL